MPVRTIELSPSDQYPLFVSVAVFLLFCVSGCSDDGTRKALEAEKPPKPVSTMTLRRGQPELGRHTTGSVAPWKTEQIGFEQAGRVVYVIEPNEMVRPEVENDAESHETGGTPIARLDDERVRIAVESAMTDVSVAKLNRVASRIAIKQRLPAAISAAEAERQLADMELNRVSRLAKQNAVSRAELDTARTRASTTKSQLAATKAELLQAKATQLTLEAQVVRAEQSLAEAERNRRNAVLVSSFPGMVSQVHAVPGSYVKDGDPVVTVQMMDPMLVEFEVAADNSRRYRSGDTLQVTVTNGQRKPVSASGMVYTVDAVADAQTRTFTVTLHVRNRLQETVTTISSGKAVARTRRIFPLNLGPIVTGDDRQLVERSAVHSVGGKDFVWRITNRKWDTPSGNDERMLTVERIPVTVTSEVIPFLGTWNFVAVEFDDPTVVDLQRDLITDELYFKPRTSVAKDTPLSTGSPERNDEVTATNWSGDQVLLDQPRWLLRAGDVVRVALMSQNAIDGFYVPMKAVRNKNGKTFVHVIDSSRNATAVVRIPVTVSSRDSMIDESVSLRIEHAGSTELQEGMQIVVGGTHFLNDGDRVRVVPASGVAQ